MGEISNLIRDNWPWLAIAGAGFGFWVFIRGYHKPPKKEDDSLTGSQLLEKWRRESMPDFLQQMRLRRESLNDYFGRGGFDFSRIPGIHNPYGQELARYVNANQRIKDGLYRVMKESLSKADVR